MIDLTFSGKHIVPSFSSAAVAIVGCGGTGSHVAPHAARIVQELKRSHVDASLALVDYDVVESGNVGRQNFYAAEVDGNKAEALATRLSSWLGLGILAIPTAVPDAWPAIGRFVTMSADIKVIVSCVDNTEARQDIHDWMIKAQGNNPLKSSQLYWVDCGNDRDSGNVFVGNGTELDGIGSLVTRLPNPTIQQPNLLEYPEPTIRLDNCALAMERGEQSLVINTLVAAHCADVLHSLLIDRKLNSMGVSFSTNPSTARPIKIPVIERENE